MIIKVEGSDEALTKELYQNVCRVVNELCLQAQTMLGDERMHSVALSVDGKIVSSGIDLSISQVRDIVARHSDVLSCPCGANHFCRCE